MKANRIKVTNYLLTSVALIAYYALTGWDNLFAAVYSFLLILSPLAINALIAFFAKTRASQVVLLCTAIAYAAWAFSLFMDVGSSSDGQAGLALLLTAIAASPVLLIACSLTFCMFWVGSRKITFPPWEIESKGDPEASIRTSRTLHALAAGCWSRTKRSGGIASAPPGHRALPEWH